jgi:hypothetical protein
MRERTKRQEEVGKMYAWKLYEEDASEDEIKI